MDIKITSLEGIPLRDIVECLTNAFSEYEVKMPSDVEFWRQRWKIASVDYTLSFGAFSNGNLVGFIVNGVANKQGRKTAFNTGTGVIKPFRGNKIPKKIYDHSIPILKSKGIECCALEVISTNERAIYVYEEIGFTKRRKLDCFSGKVKESSKAFNLEKIDHSKYFLSNRDVKSYSWDYSQKALWIAGDKYSYYNVLVSNRLVGAFALDQSSKMLAQYYTLNESIDDFEILFAAISSLTSELRINNLLEDYANTKDYLLTLGLNNHISQYEMTMDL